MFDRMLGVPEDSSEKTSLRLTSVRGIKRPRLDLLKNMQSAPNSGDVCSCEVGSNIQPLRSSMLARRLMKT